MRFGVLFQLDKRILISFEIIYKKSDNKFHFIITWYKLNYDRSLYVYQGDVIENEIEQYELANNLYQKFKSYNNKTIDINIRSDFKLSLKPLLDKYNFLMRDRPFIFPDIVDLARMNLKYNYVQPKSLRKHTNKMQEDCDKGLFDVNINKLNF